MNRPRVAGSQSEEVSAGAIPAAVEMSIAQLAAEVLSVPVVEPDDDLFALGADSLMLTRLVARMRAELDLPITLKQVMSHPSPRGMTGVIAETSEESGMLTRLPRGLDLERPFPLSAAQRRFLLAERLNPRDRGLIAASQIDIAGPFDPDVLRAALAGTIERHEVLRTVYPFDSDPPTQMALPVGAYEIPLTVHTSVEPERVDRIVAEAMERSFDLDREIPFRALLIERRSGEWQLALLIHHIAYDGWSDHVLTHDLARIYRGLLKDEQVQLPPAAPYREHVAWEKEWLASPAYEVALARSTEALDEIADVQWIGAAGEQRSEGPGTILKHNFVVEQERLFDIRASAANGSATVPRALGFAFYLAAASIARSPHIAIGTNTEGREEARFADTVGAFTQTIAINPGGRAQATREALTAFSAGLDLAVSCAAVPFDALVAALKPRRTQRNPVFQAYYVLQHNPPEDLDFGTARGSVRRVPEDYSAFDLTLEMIPAGTGIDATATSFSNAVDGPALSSFVGAFEAALWRLASLQTLR